MVRVYAEATDPDRADDLAATMAEPLREARRTAGEDGDRRNGDGSGPSGRREAGVER